MKTKGISSQTSQLPHPADRNSNQGQNTECKFQHLNTSETIQKKIIQLLTKNTINNISSKQDLTTYRTTMYRYFKSKLHYSQRQNTNAFWSFYLTTTATHHEKHHCYHFELLKCLPWAGTFPKPVLILFHTLHYRLNSHWWTFQDHQLFIVYSNTISWLYFIVNHWDTINNHI